MARETTMFRVRTLLLSLCFFAACGEQVPDPTSFGVSPTDVEGTVIGVEMEELTAWYGELREDYSLLVLSQVDNPCDLTPHGGSDVALIVGFCSPAGLGTYTPGPKAEFCGDEHGAVAFVENGLGVDLAVGEAGEVNVNNIDFTMRADLDIDFGQFGHLRGNVNALLCDEVIR
jgi:hypothetical protein